MLFIDLLRKVCFADSIIFSPKRLYIDGTSGGTVAGRC